jgi:arylsulfatase A
MVHNTNENAYAIREGDWVLVNAKPAGADAAPKKAGKNDSDGRAPRVELYNLKDDISQKNNLAAKHPERVQSLQALLDKLYAQGHSAPRLD